MKTLTSLALLGALLAPTAHAGSTPQCDALDGERGVQMNIDSGITFERGDLVLRDDARTVLMMITEERDLYLNGKHVELDADGRVLVDRYYITVEQFVDDALDIAGDAAGLGISAAVEALAAVFAGAGEMERFEQRMEERAGEIELKADAMCERFRRLEAIEREMRDVVPGFEPVMFAETL